MPSQAVAGPQEAGRTGATASIAEAVQKDFSAAQSSSAHHQPEASAIQVADAKSTYIQGEQAAQAQRLSLRERMHQMQQQTGDQRHKFARTE